MTVVPYQISLDWRGKIIKKKLTIRSFIGNVLFIAVLLLIAARFLSVFSGSPFPIDIITSDSMSPSLMGGDLVAWTPTNIEDVEIGDIIVFKSWVSWPDEKLVVHRIVDIKNIWGKPALATKGDKNDWTDQAGPHIPEPYITEKNFIGKTLSIGKQPLKIPFIGNIGIWINEGFKLLSQPSASKGTLTYMGVFTPLTISVVLLITSLFILPVKPKTTKEKIRFYIFGSQPLNIKKVFVVFLTIFVTLLVLIHFFAYDSISSSVGVGEFPEESSLKLGSLVPGQTGFSKHLPVINPGVMPVKGIIFGGEKLNPFVDRMTFEIGPGEYKDIGITATIPEGTKNGSYVGNIMLYSSPLWFIFPDGLMQNLYNWNPEVTVIILDILSACILTFVTVFLIISTAFIGKRYRDWEIDLSWHYAPRLYLKKGVAQRISSLKKKTKKILLDRYKWINKINLTDIDPKPLILASLVIIPVLLLINSEILAMLIASLTTGIIAYFISCKLRKKIVLASVFSMIFALSYIIVKTNYLLITSSRSMIESIALGIGAMGVYLLLLAFLLIPLSIISWFFTHQIRNLKERRDPLLILEGRCDL